jgi:bis(5'-nucleosidyl)-tetraphosphatase
MEERSAGAVVFHGGPEGRRYLLLRYPAGHWDFPKGNIEKGEREIDTVLREIWEETGLKQISEVAGFRREIEYFYRRDGKLVHKSVVFLLMKAEDDSVRLSEEHQDYGWFPFESAIKKVTYANSKRVLQDAHKHLQTSC